MAGVEGWNRMDVLTAVSRKQRMASLSAFPLYQCYLGNLKKEASASYESVQSCQNISEQSFLLEIWDKTIVRKLLGITSFAVDTYCYVP